MPFLFRTLCHQQTGNISSLVLSENPVNGMHLLRKFKAPAQEA